ncbi:MAG: hypothetical protein LDLANPLL_01473 [Turneriella sp.]|nr:hypothetical protein [Turneriella sp.]
MRRFFVIYFFLVFWVSSFCFSVFPDLEKNDASETMGKVTWPSEYLLDLYLPQWNEEGERAYLSGVVQNLIGDELALQRRALTHGKLTPSVIEYPVLPSHENIPSNERSQLLSRFPKPLVLPLKVVRLRERAKSFSCSQKIENRYSLVSKLSGESSRIRVEIILCHGSQQIFERASRIEEKDLVETIHELMNPVRAKLTGDQYATLDLKTNPPNASVYIDDQFVGKTPLQYSYLIPDDYRLVIKRDNYEIFTKALSVKNGDRVSENYTLTLAKMGGSLIVSSSPAGARIYLDADYKGITPKTIDKLSFGTYRLHILKEGAGEIYQNVTLTEKNPQASVEAELTQFVANKSVGFWGISYKSWYVASLTAAAVTFGSAVAFYVWRDAAQEDIYARLGGKSSSMYTASDVAFQAERKNAYNERENYATGFLISSGVFAIAAIYFYVQHLLERDEGIVMLKQPPRYGSVDIALGFSPAQSNLGIKFRF